MISGTYLPENAEHIFPIIPKSLKYRSAQKKFQGLLKSLWLHAQQLKIEIDFAQDGRTQTHEKNIHTETASMFQIYAPNIPQMLDCPVRDKITIVHKSRETNKVRTKLLVR